MNRSLYLVAGLGKTGYSIARYLRRRNQPFVVYDTRSEMTNLREFQAEFPGVDIFLGDFPKALYPELKAIISSPGLALEEPFLQQALNDRIPVFGDIECLAREISAPVIAITGTNGKSTVTTLVGEMAKAAGLKVAVAGNIGLPVLDLLDDGQAYDLWVLELSSFQLDLTSSLKPLAATILNISPDHLDRYPSLEAYIESKQAIYLQSQAMLINRDDAQTNPTITNPLAKRLSFGLQAPKTPQEWGIIEQEGSIYLAQGTQCLFDLKKLRLKGRHNWQNALAASALAFTAGIEISVIVHVLENFKGLAHRCQWVRTLDEVDWVNDSKGTNTGATVSALFGIGSSIQGKIILIAGGIGKGADFTELNNSVVNYVRAVVLIGRDAPQLAEALGSITNLHYANSLAAAVACARAQARAGDVVLLSPACASFDMFKDFNHRGESFINLVEQL